MRETEAPVLAASYFDGTHGRAQPVELQRVDKDLLLRGDGFERRIPAGELQWPEPGRHGVRVLHLARGGAIQCADGAAWDAMSSACRSAGEEPTMVRDLSAVSSRFRSRFSATS